MTPHDDRLTELLQRTSSVSHVDFARVAEAARSELALNRRTAPWLHQALLLVAMNVVFCAAAIAMMRASTDVQSIGIGHAMAAVVLFALTIFGAFAAVRPGGRAGRIAYIVVSAVMMAIIVVGGGPVTTGLGLTHPTCAAIELSLAVPSLAFSFVVLRRFAFQIDRTLVAGIASGAVSALSLHFFCAKDTWTHLLVFHIVPWMLIAILAVFGRKRMTSTSYAP